MGYSNIATYIGNLIYKIFKMGVMIRGILNKAEGNNRNVTRSNKTSIVMDCNNAMYESELVK
jgi:hypothetical protein